MGCEHGAELVAVPVEFWDQQNSAVWAKCSSPETGICWCWTCIFDKVCVLSVG